MKKVSNNQQFNIQDKNELQYMLRSDHRNFKSIPKHIRNSKDFAIKALSYNIKIFGLLDTSLQNDLDIIKILVKKRPASILDLDNSYRNNKELILLAITSNPNAIQYASERLKGDAEVVLSSFKGLNAASAFQYASAELKNDLLFIKKAVQINGLIIQYVGKEIKKDKEISLLAVQQNGAALQYLFKKFKKDKEVILKAIQQNGDAFMFSKLNGYQSPQEIVEKEGYEWLPCFLNSGNFLIRKFVILHPSFFPDKKTIEKGLAERKNISDLFVLRKDEWIAKIEEDRLKKFIN